MNTSPLTHARGLSVSGLSALATAIGLLAAPMAQAGPWLVPNDTIYSGSNAVVAIDASNSDDLLEYDHAANLEQIKAVGPDGAEIALDNAMRARSHTSFDVRLSAQGTTRVMITNANVGGTYVVDGKTYRLNTFRRPAPPAGGQPGQAQGPGQGQPPGAAPGGNGPGAGAPPPGRPLMGVADPAEIPANATEIKLVQSTQRSETFATLGIPSGWKPSGVGLELVPGGTPPTDVVADETATFKLAFYGQPAANVDVEVAIGNQRYLPKPLVQKLKTDANGVVRVKWPSPGIYWINAQAEGPGTIPNAVRRSSYTAVVLVEKP